MTDIRGWSQRIRWAGAAAFAGTLLVAGSALAECYVSVETYGDCSRYVVDFTDELGNWHMAYGPWGSSNGADCSDCGIFHNPGHANSELVSGLAAAHGGLGQEAGDAFHTVATDPLVAGTCANPSADMGCPPQCVLPPCPPDCLTVEPATACGSPSILVTVPGAGGATYVEDRGNRGPLGPMPGLVDGGGTWVYRESNGMPGLQRGGISPLGDPDPCPDGGAPPDTLLL